MKELGGRVGEAVRHFWKTRQAQAKKQGAKSGRKDQGSRSAVTGGGTARRVFCELGSLRPYCLQHARDVVRRGFNEGGGTIRASDDPQHDSVSALPGWSDRSHEQYGFIKKRPYSASPSFDLTIPLCRYTNMP
jgi:hypothetical protein